ncbi:MAG: hypothetical protein JST70_13070 [Bacteroidetes bacterium]|nr:hypothetical protein [Bacteroidota bacterium]
MNYIKLIVMLCCSMSSVGIYAQPSLKDVQEVFSRMKSLRDFGYDYTVDAIFPDGTKDQMRGEMYRSASKNITYSYSDDITYMATKKWVYQADHKHRQVFVYGVKSQAGNKEGSGTPPGSDFFGEFVDSFLMRYSKLDYSSISHDTLKFHISFTTSYTAFKSMDIVYNKASKLPIKIVLNAFYHEPWQTRGDKTGTRKTITCDHYHTSEKNMDMNNYFTVSGNKIVLKKYKTYQLKTIL